VCVCERERERATATERAKATAKRASVARAGWLAGWLADPHVPRLRGQGMRCAPHTRADGSWHTYTFPSTSGADGESTVGAATGAGRASEDAR